VANDDRSRKSKYECLVDAAKVGGFEGALAPIKPGTEVTEFHFDGIGTYNDFAGFEYQGADGKLHSVIAREQKGALLNEARNIVEPFHIKTLDFTEQQPDTTLAYVGVDMKTGREDSMTGHTIKPNTVSPMVDKFLKCRDPFTS
jgi:hypothetical protein